MNYATVTDDGEVFLEKDATASLSYLFKLDQVLGQGDALAAVSCAATPADLTVSNTSLNGTDLTAVLAGGTPGTWYALVITWVSQAGETDEFLVRVFVPVEAASTPQLGSALFPNRFTATQQLRRDRLALATAAALPNLQLSDDYLWEKLLAAESDIGHRLGVPLVPTQYFPTDPTDDDLAGLPAGMPWDIDPGYDLGPSNYDGDRWGMVSLRHAPLISILRYRFAYPAVDGMVYDMPLSWLRPDKKAGLVNVVPVSFTVNVPLSAIVMQAMAGGRTIPLMLQVTYQAGLANVQRDYPELIDVVKKLAVLKILEDVFLPQSGSISADGLSQSLSIDMDKYHDAIDYAIYGPKGSNGGLMTAIRGVRGLVY